MTAIGKDPTVEKELRRAEGRWRWLRLSTAFAIFIITSALLVGGFGAAILAGWVAEMVLAQVLLGLLIFGLLIIGLGLLIVVATGALPRNQLANEIEGVNPPMLDRLNTLVAYEKKKVTPKEKSFLTRITDQARSTIRQKRPTRPFHSLPAQLWFLFALLAVAACTFFWVKTNPWNVLAQRMEVRKAAQLEVLPELDLSDPQANVSEFSSVWGDVRITDPGKDLKMTKVDVVPLQIEAASNQPLKSVSWFTSVNGGEQKENPLDAPPEPNYAAYQPTIYLDEHGLSDWDVLAYYASAKGTDEQSFSSEIYFVEIRPFREDILKAMGGGGEGSEGYDILALLTELINRQRDILKETHHFYQRPSSSPEVREQDRKKLVAGETELRDATTNAYAKVAAMENMSVGEVLDHLSKAESWMTKGVGALEDNSPEDAAQYEFSALSELVATRKIFQKTMSESQSNKPPQDDEESDPTAEKPKTDNRDVNEYRDREKAAQSQMNDLMQKQKDLTQQANQGGNSRDQQQKMSQQQQEMQKDLGRMKSDFPEMFNGLDQQAREASQAMNDSANSMKRGRGGQEESQRALDKLKDLQNGMDQVEQRRELQHAHELKRSLDRQIDNLDQMSQKPEGPSSQEQKQAANDAQSTMDQLKEIAGNDPKGMGSQLKESMQGQQQQERDSAMDQLKQGQTGEAGKQASANARDKLKEVSDAFQQSQPETVNRAREKDPLGPGTPEEQAEQKEQQLESLMRRLEDNKLPSQEDLKKQLGEMSKDNEEARHRFEQIVGNLDDRDKNAIAPPLTPEQIQELMKELDGLRVQMAESKEQQEKPDMTHLDPEKWPAQYRDRIRKYFEKLSEQ